MSPLRLLAIGLLVIAWAESGSPSFGQLPPVPGVVWTPPSDPALAQQDLRRMQEAGVVAVRTGMLQDETLLTLADTLGLHLYQDLPLDYLPASELVDTLAYAQRVLELALAQARNHPSARHFGLARRSDTSDPAACAFFERLTERIRQAPNSRSYYLTAFIEADRCAPTVDLVLLDARDVADPRRLLNRWRAAHGESPAGIGALGTWVAPASPRGLQLPHSHEAQARHLETQLHALLTGTPRPPVVFVYRWRDEATAFPSPAHELPQPYRQGYGLLGPDDVPRPAFEVVSGFFTNRQTAFAFTTGTPAPSAPPWPILTGWLVFLLVGVSFASSPRFRYMVPRYFRAHIFYRESVREGREVLVWISIVLLVAIGLSVGVLGQVILETLRTTPAFQVLFHALPPAVQRVGVALMAQPWLLIILLSSMYALSLALWAALLSIVSRRRHPLMPGQALMMVLWTRWPTLGLLIGAMVIPTLPPALAQPAVLGLAGLWLLVSLYAVLRTLIDYASITYVPGSLTLLLGLAHPLILMGLAGGILYLRLGPLLEFAWHLATRS